MSLGWSFASRRLPLVVPTLFALDPKWTNERTNAEIKLFSFENIAEAVREEKNIAIVFPFEGTFSDGAWIFAYEMANHMPLLITYEQALKINTFIAFRNKLEIAEIERIILSDAQRGRTLFLNLVKTIFKEEEEEQISNNDDDGMKVMSAVPEPELT